uniref:PWWP domain-containing protein n=1 Tax=Saimiri boliviensis boliviensis TaxID=39432 RepID=A0A2K6ST46_SAIBB
MAGTKTSTKKKNKRKKEYFLHVRIPSLEEKIQVKSPKSHIEAIASSLASQNEVPAAPLEELAYRRSLRVALDVLSEGLVWSRESSTDTGRAERSPRGKPPEPVSSPRDSSSSSPPGGGVVGSSGPHRRRECVQQSPSGPFTCEKDPKCKVDHKKGLRKSDNPGGLSVLSAGDGSQDGSQSRIHRKSGTPTSKRGRKSAPKSSLCPRGSSLSESGAEEDSGSEAGRWAAPSSPCGVREGDPCAHAEGRNPGLPSGSLTPSACPERGECPAKKRPRLDGSQKQPAVQLEPRAAGAAPSPGPDKHYQSPPASSRAPVDETRRPRPDSQKLEEDCQSSEVSVRSNSMRSILEEDEEDEEPPRILLYHEPRSFAVGMLVWLKYQKYPFWPAVVKSVRRRGKKASVLFIEGDMNPKRKGITVSLRRLKHFDSREDFGQATGWCVSLITDHRVRLGCGSFAGSFLEYYAADISYPVRKSIRQDVLGTKFPQLSKGSPEEPALGSPLGQRQPCRKVRPDRSRAARDRANQKLVEAKGAESHLRATLKSRKPSRGLQIFLSSSQDVTCVETYLEDEGQLDLVGKYLQGVYQEVGAERLRRTNGDRIRFILDELLREAIICAISPGDEVDYRTAEEKYIKGPSLSYREKELFDNRLLEERRRLL